PLKRRAESPARQVGGATQPTNRHRCSPCHHAGKFAVSSKSNDFLFTSESVSEGHPDKVADQISDAILDAIFTQDPNARVAAETLCNTGLVVLAGEITTSANIDYIQ